MRQKIQNIRFPFYILIIAAYPSITLLETNFKEIDPAHIIRPLIFSIVFSALVYYGFLKIFRDHKKAGVIATFFVFIVFSYGRVYSYLIFELPATISFGKANHIIVTAASALILWLFIALYNKTKIPDPLTITAVGLVLIIMPGYKIAGNIWEEKYIFTPPDIETPAFPSDEPMPDIYHIVVDSYSRQDQLIEMGLDNSQFLQSLEEKGFFVADCSRSNYQRTTLSLTSALNLKYVWQLFPDQPASTRNDPAIYSALTDNLAHNMLAELGYTIITNQNGFAWADMAGHADIYIQPEAKSIIAPYLLPFERLFLENSAFRVLMDSGALNTFQDGYLLFGEHYEQVTAALLALKQIPDNPDPTYAYFHLILPHSPYIFNPDGSIAPELMEIEGYLRTIEFTNNALTPIISKILEKSETPPIIIVHGDHGYIASMDHRYDILYAIYFPEAIDQFYSTMSPVNTYRIIFRNYLGLDLPNLADRSIRADIGKPFRDKSADLPPLPDYCP